MMMRYGSSLNPKWMIDALWRQKKMIFFAISAASIAGNAVVLVESLGIDKACMSLLNWLLPQLRDAEAEFDRPGETTMPTSENFDDHAAEELQTFVISHVSMKRHANTERTPNVSFKQGSVTDKPARRAAAAARDRRKPTKRASLFTVEPLDSASIETPSINSSMSATHNLGGTQIMDTAQSSMGAAQLSIDTAHYSGATQLLIPITYATGHLTQEPQNKTPLVLHDDSQDEGFSVLHTNSSSDALRDDSAGPDDYDLNRQEFNDRVETFITKVKRSLIMQREDSFNRLLQRVGVGVKRS